MTLRDFLDASYVLRAEEHQRINPLSELLSLSESLGIGQKMERIPTKKDVKAQNDAAIASLEALAAQVKGMPRRKGR